MRNWDDPITESLKQVEVDNNVKDIVEKYGCTYVEPDKIISQNVDIYAPCALGATINKNSIPKLNCKIITTEKDYYRLSKYQRKGLKVLKVKLEIQDLYEFKKILFNINEKN